MSAGKYWIKDVAAGSDWSEVYFVQNDDGSAVNLTGYVARMKVRKTVGSPTAALSLSSPSGGISISGVAGSITVTITDTQTSALCVNNSRTSYVYDLEIESGGGVITRILEGKLIVTPEVTR